MYEGQTSMDGALVDSMGIRGPSMSSSDTNSFTAPSDGWYYVATYVSTYDRTGGTWAGATVTISSYIVI